MEPVSKVLYTLYRGKPIHGRWVVACLEGAWPKLLGERVAKACRPVSWDDYRLVVEVVDPVWTESLESVRDGMLERIRTATDDEVRCLAFVNVS